MQRIVKYEMKFFLQILVFLENKCTGIASIGNSVHNTVCYFTPWNRNKNLMIHTQISIRCKRLKTAGISDLQYSMSCLSSISLWVVNLNKTVPLSDKLIISCKKFFPILYAGRFVKKVCRPYSRQITKEFYLYLHKKSPNLLFV